MEERDDRLSEQGTGDAPVGDPAAQGQEPEFKNWKEHLYDKVHLSVRTLDIIIGVLVALIFVFILLGMLKMRLG